MVEAIPYKRPGQDLTCQVTAAVVGKRFVRPSADRTSGPGLSNTAEGSVYRVAHSGAGANAIGVAKYDQPTVSGKVGVMTAGIVPVEAGAAITAGAYVMSDATGRAVPWVSAASEANAKLGMCMSAASGAGVDAEIKLMLG